MQKNSNHDKVWFFIDEIYLEQHREAIIANDELA